MVSKRFLVSGQGRHLELFDAVDTKPKARTKRRHGRAPPYKRPPISNQSFQYRHQNQQALFGFYGPTSEMSGRGPRPLSR